MLNRQALSYITKDILWNISEYINFIADNSAGSNQYWISCFYNKPKLELANVMFVNYIKFKK